MQTARIVQSVNTHYMDERYLPHSPVRIVLCGLVGLGRGGTMLATPAHSTRVDRRTIQYVYLTTVLGYWLLCCKDGRRENSVISHDKKNGFNQITWRGLYLRHHVQIGSVIHVKLFLELKRTEREWLLNSYCNGLQL
jgi:hypothetical protein